MGTLNYSRHFTLLAFAILVLAVTRSWTATQGVVPSFGLFGALHAASVALSVRPATPWRRLVFVAGGASLCMMSVSLSVYAGRFGVLPGLAKPALLLALSSSLGAVGYCLLLQASFGFQLNGQTIASIAFGCTLATVSVLASGIYVRGGAAAFAAAWWVAFSLGLRHGELRRASSSRIH